MLKIPLTYQKILSEETEKQYFKDIVSFLETEKKGWKIIYPEEKNIFNALNLTSFEDIKVVIIGQDPYHQKWQAHWLAFSVQDWVKIPPSLRNIFKELWVKRESWNLKEWSKQWVLLLNAILTVEDSKPASHSKIGWEKFTDNITKIISKELDWVIFILWGNFAKSKKTLIDQKKHFIIEWVHPSPLSASRWFFWSKPFSKANDILKKVWKKEINW